MITHDFKQSEYHRICGLHISIFYSFLQISSPRGCYQELFGAILLGNLDAYSRVRSKCFGGLIFLSTHNIPTRCSVACILFSLLNSLHFVHTILCMPWCSKMSTPTPFAFINQFVFTVEVWLSSLSSLDVCFALISSYYIQCYGEHLGCFGNESESCFLEMWSGWMNVHTVNFIRFHPSLRKDWTTNTALHCYSDISQPFVCWPGYSWCLLRGSTVAMGNDLSWAASVSLIFSWKIHFQERLKGSESF